MSEQHIRALVVRESESGVFSRQVELVPLDFLPDNDVTIRVIYAGLNFKDALSAHGHRGITRRFPHIPGVDAVGEVVNDRSGVFAPGSRVICTSYDFGMNTFGGFAEFARVPSGWLVPVPEGMSLEEAMILGTAGFTVALALDKMERFGQRPEMGEIVVTGASGGVGSMAVAILARAGYRVVAATGKNSLHGWLKELGAVECIGREAVNDTSGRPLLSPMWAGAIDNVGGNTLVTLLKRCKKEGCVASIGLVDSPDFQMTVYPFILNGVNLLGIDSADTPMDRRRQLWHRLSADWKPTALEALGRFVSLEEIPAAMESMMAQESAGRIIARIGEGHGDR